MSNISNSVAKKEVIEYCKRTGLNLNSKDKIPMISDKSMSFIECFDSWIDARQFLINRKQYDYNRKTI
jgi:hypothetical protein